MKSLPKFIRCQVNAVIAIQAVKHAQRAILQQILTVTKMIQKLDLNFAPNVTKINLFLRTF